MSAADTYVRARIDSATKKRAQDALHSMGLSVSDGIRLLMFRIAEEQKLPFEVKVPDAETQSAISELELGKGKKTKDFNSLLSALNEED